VLDIDHATPEQKSSFLAADRYSSAEIAVRVDQRAWHGRRAAIRADQIRGSLPRLFGGDSTFSARDLAFVMRNSDNRAAMVADLLVFAHKLATSGRPDVAATGVFPRVVHSLGTALNLLCEYGDTPLDRMVPGLAGALSKATLDWMASACIPLPDGVSARDWALWLHSLAVRA
jgi:hypothetical protein